MNYEKSKIYLSKISHDHILFHPGLDDLNLSVHFLDKRVFLSVAACREKLISLGLQPLKLGLWALLGGCLQRGAGPSSWGARLIALWGVSGGV